MPRDPIQSLQSLQRQLPAMALRAMERTMQEAEAQGKRTTAFQNQTGRLRRSIRGGIVAATPDMVIGALSAGDEDAQPGREGWETPSAEYGPMIELGTSRRPPHPFVRPTIVAIGSQGILPRAMREEFKRFSP